MDNRRLYEESILLIGPSGTGKSTVAEVLRELTKMPRLSLDRIANNDRRIGIRRNFKSSDEYNLYLLDKVLTVAEKEMVPGVVDFGAGHSVFNDRDNLEKAKKLMSKFKNVILLLPCKDMEQSLKIMAERSTGDYSTNRDFILNPSNKELSTIIVYGNGRTPEKIANDILNRIKQREDICEEMK